MRETVTITRTLTFRDGVAWLETVAVQESGFTSIDDRLVGGYRAHAGEGWVAHRAQNASVTLTDVSFETWQAAVRLTHLYA